MTKKNIRSSLENLSQSKVVRVLLVLAVLAFGAYLRFTGIEWDADFHLHPDERFLTMVEDAISPVSSLGEYFDTSQSTLNPHNILDGAGNQTYPFFVYGTLPIFTVRYLGEWLGMDSYGSVNILGRILSGVFDVGTILLVFLLAQRLFGKFWLSWMASFLYACAVLPIQISHYFIVDNFTTFFAMLAFLAAAAVLKQKAKPPSMIRPGNPFQWIRLYANDFRPFVFFGIALGMAAASKINAIAIAVLLPLALYLRNPKRFKDLTSFFWNRYFHYLMLAAVISFITFRIFQPYAFKGPSFFNISLNDQWIADLKELSVLSSGISNYPPSMQWARRSIWFPLKNLVVWGVGIPFGLFAAAGLIWMAWKIVKGKWKKYSLLWIWTFIYTLWQVVRWNPTMRYLLLIYPGLAITAAWFACHLYKKIGRSDWFNPRPALKNLLRFAIIFVLIAGTACWSLAFIKIYEKPMTRIAASEWIYDNVEGAVNLQLEDAEGNFIQPLPYPHTFIQKCGNKLRLDFQPASDGIITEIYFDHVLNPTPSGEIITLSAVIRDKDTDEILAEANLSDPFLPNDDSRGQSFNLDFSQPIEVNAAQEYELIISTPNNAADLKFYGTLGVNLSSNGESVKQALFESSPVLADGDQYDFTFTAKRSGSLKAVELFRVLNLSSSDGGTRIIASLRDKGTDEVLAQTNISGIFKDKEDYRGSNTVIEFSQPVPIEGGEVYCLSLQVQGGGAQILISGSEPAKETDWDDTLPLYMYGLAPFDQYDGVYQSDLNFQMYWADNEEKRQRFLSILEQADYFIITSNRQWGSVTQLPDEFPLTTLFYKELIGCTREDVQYCYRVAQPGMYTGELGFELEAVFQSNPEIFGVEFNSQFAEEAFTVYDHPKVLIFKKTADFDLAGVADKLYQVDLDKVMNQNPAEAEKYKGSLMLSEERFEAQKTQGTWADLFDYESLQNEHQILAVLIWYFFITVLGWIFYPTGRIIFKGLSDKGFGLLKISGMIFWAFAVWWLGSIGVAVKREIIFLVLLAFIGLNFVLGWKDRREIKEEIRDYRKHFLLVEAISLAFFLFFLLIRLGNPDLWHPYKGGEKPMDFSYFNAVIKSESFPPYDPWYAGGYINYYYYGFVLAAVPVKLLGIVPSIAYNLILATFFSFTAMAAFTFGWNVYGALRQKIKQIGQKIRILGRNFIPSRFMLALTTALFVLVVGNLGTIYMLINGFQKIAISDVSQETAGIFHKITLLIKGIGLYFSGKGFTYYPGDWYWIPSRTIPGEPITEFPYFTYLYGDPHAHLFAYPITILVLCWILALLRNRLENKKALWAGAQLLGGALFIGCLYPTNTWDYPVFLFIACLLLFYVLFNYVEPPEKFFPYFDRNTRKILFSILVLVVFAGSTWLLYYPFSKWFGQAYSSIKIWEGDHTPIGSYLLHWGLFLVVIYSFLVWEMREWLSTTPVSALKPFYDRRNLITIGFILVLVLVFLLAVADVQVIFLIAPAAILAVLLFFRPDYPEITRFIILLTLGALGLTLMVEVIVIDGDVGRMNTVFKFYLQAWTFFSISSAYYLFHLLPDLVNKWKPSWKKAWSALLTVLLVSVFLFPITASFDKITDRISDNVPLTLDGMDYMQSATYLEEDTLMDLSQDYDAIRWMQANVEGTPVIIEGNVSEYKWGNRYTIYTGLPGVIGWNWHQRQQRAINPSDWIYERIDDVTEFYATIDLERCKAIIEKYDIGYIVVGQLERALYTEEGIDKFTAQNDILWDEVYSSQETRIYRVRK